MIVFRNDDVNPNSSISDILEMYATIKEFFPDAEIYSCVTLFAQTSDNGSAYQEIPIGRIDFPIVDKMFDLSSLPKLEHIVSHGVWHLDHRAAMRELAEYSIVSSCSILNTDIFIPPFWRWNTDVEKICRDNSIKLWTEHDWVNIERNELTSKDDHYLFHSWTFTPAQFRERLQSIAANKSSSC